jgi:hypothetical protein
MDQVVPPELRADERSGTGEGLRSAQGYFVSQPRGNALSFRLPNM